MTEKYLDVLVHDFDMIKLLIAVIGLIMHTLYALTSVS